MKHQQPGRLTLVRDDDTAATTEDGLAVGQIWIARPDRGADRHVLVSEVHDEHVHAMLCGGECALATDTDAVLAPDTTGLDLPLLIHGDVSGSILKRRLWRAVGQIEPHLAERIALRGRGLDFNSTDLGRGAAIISESDPRWGWKLDRHRQFRGLRARAGELGWQICKLGPRED